MKTVFCAAMLLATSVLASDLVSIQPAQLEFGKVPRGVAKTMTLRLKTTEAVAVLVTPKADPPFTVNGAEFQMERMSYGDVAVSLPPSTDMGDYSATLHLQLAPVGIKTQSTETMDVAIHAKVVSPPDFSVTAEVEACKKQGKTMTCTVQLHPATTAPVPVAVHIVVAASAGDADETTAVDRMLDFKPQPSEPVEFDTPAVSAKAKRITLHVSIDPENKIAEENEDNNSITLTLDIHASQ